MALRPPPRYNEGAVSAIRIVAVTPTGEHTGPAFVTRKTGCGLETVTTPTYPDSPRGSALRRARVYASVTLRELAAAAGIMPVELSALERGSATCVDDDEWDRLFALIPRPRASTPEQGRPKP